MRNLFFLQAFSPVTIFTSRKAISSDFIGVFPSMMKSFYFFLSHPSFKNFGNFFSLFFDRGLGKNFS